MTFWKPPASPQNPSPQWQPPSNAGRGDRALATRIDEPDVPHFRQKAETLEGRGKVGLTNAVVIDRLPRGCLFKVAGGWFDLDGYWCVPKADKQVEVRRGSSKKILRLLTEAQRAELGRVRLQARRKGVR